MSLWELSFLQTMTGAVAGVGGRVRRRLVGGEKSAQTAREDRAAQAKRRLQTAVRPWNWRLRTIDTRRRSLRWTD